MRHINKELTIVAQLSLMFYMLGSEILDIRVRRIFDN